MNIISHTLGFPRIGLNRDLKKAQENYWLGNINENELLKIGFNLRKTNWEKQKNAGIDLLPVGDFAWYDHVLTTSLLLGNIPLRHQNKNQKINLNTIFLIGRGQDNTGKTSKASEMTKWFNTNYHYIVPEFIKNQKFKLMWTQLLDEIDEALDLGFDIKPILIGPMTYLWLGKIKSINNFNKLSLLNELIPVYQQIFIKLSKKGIKWIQIDEPILSLELSDEWIKSFQSTYHLLQSDVKILLTTYFDSINQNYNMICSLPIQGLHVDLACGKNNIYQINKKLPKDWVLSLGIIDGRNIWRANLIEMFHYLQPLTYCREHIWIGSSCSLMHCPIDLNEEKKLDNELKSWFSFAIQKCHEILLLSNALKNNNDYELKLWSIPIINRKTSNRIHDIFVQKRIKNINKKYYNRKNKYLTRSLTQRLRFNLPIFPTTTIGSFPQTKEIRSLRLDFKQGKINKNEYCKYIKKHISKIIFEQEKLDLDVLVHGEPERNDMVEYFSENLNGFVVTENGWVQSYGSRCVKPPIIFSDISRSKPITIEWIKYAQSLTKKPVKGMLTGPVTILCWSFLRDDISRECISKQIALALRDEVSDLEKAGISIIQIDEPALREGLPLHKSDWIDYFKWATNAFRLSSSVVSDETQIHTHMCYSSFNDIMDAIIKLDVDVITIESSRSDMELLKTFKKFNYQNEIGPGIYDIHSPNIPNIESIEKLLNKAIQIIPKNRLWVNPDCGLKTRSWKEIYQSLKNMVKAAQNCRKIFIK